ncbi:hypothetical protein TELCIR_11549 [Teladorsagia circumcincta]|uniref:Uncharacterized protein n=1 Tax=Teladorsagia circumcincta TaxID=45464 RepID=A0A2G9U961_TELCI|nr:hypothetical protein TELCIR_11549 [Teladorsagia circumcincta]
MGSKDPMPSCLLGERVELTLGKGVVTWKRKTSDGEQFIKYCGPTEKGPRCAQFVKEVSRPLGSKGWLN